MRPCSIVAVVLVLGTAAVVGQAPGRPAFEVASIRANASGSSNSSSTGVPRSGVTATNVTVRTLVLTAYRVNRLRLTGGPDWIDRERFDIVAKGPDNSRPDELPLMWQSLLEDRFKLRVRTEARDQPVYRLVVARADGRLGPQLTRSTADCAAFDAARRSGTVPPPGPGGLAPCNVRASMLADGQGIISIAGRGLSQLASSLTLVATPDRVVLDQTGLAGGFDLELRWRAEPNPRTATVGTPLEEPLSVFTALQEQLGLKLEPTRAPIEVVVIDSVERPLPD